MEAFIVSENQDIKVNFMKTIHFFQMYFRCGA